VRGCTPPLNYQILDIAQLSYVAVHIVFHRTAVCARLWVTECDVRALAVSVWIDWIARVWVTAGRVKFTLTTFSVVI
jgi:hypothetical protein